MNRFLIPALAALGLTPTTSFAEELGNYMAYLGTDDMRNSSGDTLTDLGAVLQQDRANYHRFGLRDDFDQTDPFFSDPALRGRIPDIWEMDADFSYILDMVAKGEPTLVLVLIYGENGVPDRIVVLEGAS